MRILPSAAAAALAFELALAGAASARAPARIIEGEAVAAGPARLRVGDTLVDLWGVRGPEEGLRCLFEGEVKDCAAVGLEQLQYELDMSNRVRCEVTGNAGRAVTAKCMQVNKECYGATCEDRLQDLGGMLVRAGYVVQRTDVARGAYDEDEDGARAGMQGLWAETHGGGVLAPAEADEAGYEGDLGPAELKIVAELLEAYCATGGPTAPTVEIGHAQIAAAGYVVEPGNPEASVKTGGMEIFLDQNPGRQSCAFRILRRTLDRATLDAWVKSLPEGFKETGARSYEAGQGVTRFVSDTGFGRQSLLVYRRGSEVEFVLSRSL